jgi:hypothetical protein
MALLINHPLSGLESDIFNMAPKIFPQHNSFRQPLLPPYPSFFLFPIPGMVFPRNK